MRSIVVLWLTVIFLLGVATSAAIAAPPVAPVDTVTDTYFGVTVRDPYRWLEDTRDPKVLDWLKAQGDHARAELDAIAGRAALARDIVRYGQSASARVWEFQRSGDLVFYLERGGRENTAKLYVRHGFKGAGRLLVDPDTFKKSDGAQVAISYYVPSHDGTLLAYGVSEGGSENATLRVLNVADARDTGLAIDRVQFGPPAWTPSNQLLYNRLRAIGGDAPESEKYLDTEAYLHEMGSDPAQDRVILSRERSPALAIKREEIPTVFTVPGSRWLFAMVADGTRPEMRLYVASLAALKSDPIAWREVISLDDSVVDLGVRGDDAFIRTHKGAPNYELRRFNLADSNAAQSVPVLAGGDHVLQEIGVAKDALYVRRTHAGTADIVRVDMNRTGAAKPLPLPFSGDATPPITDPRSPGAAFFLGSWIRLGGIYFYSPKENKVTDTGMQPYGPYDRPADLMVREVSVKSWDGTLVPLSIVHKRTLRRDGSNPVLLEGYGAYGFSTFPSFGPVELAFLERGGILATAHVRGGGENGRAWYDGGRGATKPNTWKDAIACAEYLVQNAYTRPERLVIWGTSAGGILAGGAITERPDLFAAAIMSVPVADTVRFEFSQNALNTPEFGTVKDETGFHNLLAMSPYARVKDGTRYPAVLLTGGLNDPRVDVWQPAKMAARLQAATTSGKPILLRVKADEGHGIGSTMTQFWSDLADVYAFTLSQTGVAGFAR